MLECLSGDKVQVREKVETLIQIFANGETLILLKLNGKEMETAKKRFEDFRRGFNQRQPLSVFEDISVTGPSGAGGKCSPLLSLNPRLTTHRSITQIRFSSNSMMESAPRSSSRSLTVQVSVLYSRLKDKTVLCQRSSPK